MLLFLKRRGWIIVCALLVGLALSVQLWLTSLFSWPQALLHSAVDLVPWLFALPVIVWAAHRFPLHGARRARHAALHLLLCLICSAALPLSTLGLMHAAGADFRPGPPRLPPAESPGFPRREEPPSENFAPPPPRSMQPPPLWRMALIRAPLHWAIYGLLVALIHGWSLARHAHQRERHTAELEHLLTEARLTSLTRQLQPHFLFNTLNTIAALVRHDSARAEILLLDLGEFLRRTLQLGDRHVVALHEELALLDLYLDIQRARFGARLHVIKKIEPEALATPVPVLILQPLVENALRHGLDATFGEVRIVIEATLAGGRLRLAVQDDGENASSTPGAGIGLSNTRARLDALYGGTAAFFPRPLAGRGFLAECLLPASPSVFP